MTIEDIATTSAAGVTQRMRDLLGRMTLEEKTAQLVGFWIDQGDEVVAPLAGEMATSARYEDASMHGIGHLTRVYGTRPVDPVKRSRWLRAEQRRLRDETRLGIPALVHEECLTGLAAWQAATYPTPLAWGASWDPELVEQVGHRIGEVMRSLGVHQGLAPVLDVIRDPRWGRVDECIAEDPFVVGTIGTAYVRGLQSAGVHATLKHFVGYSASQAGRNHAPAHIGPRELRDVFLPPFEMAVRDGGVRSVMNSYTEIDGVPVAAASELLTTLLRDEWGFEGVVVSDYFAVIFLQTMHAIAADPGEAAALALAAGIDVELPTGDAFRSLPDLVRDGRVSEDVLDRAVLRVLTQKEQLGLFDEDFDIELDPPVLDAPRDRTLAGRLAEESVVLLKNDGVLPLAAPRRIALVGPNADSAEALMGCYSFANHVLAHHPGVPYGFEIPSVREAFEKRFSDAEIVVSAGCDIESDDRSGFAEAVDAARTADIVVLVLGDRAGLFGRGTVGEGNDVESLDLPGVQAELAAALIATGTPVVTIVLSGRPYALAPLLDGDASAAAVLQAFFPGEEGATALSRLVAGDLSPSGRLPVSLPRAAGAQPFSYLHPPLGGASEVTSADSTPVRPFGFGLSYTTFVHDELRAPAAAGAGETVRVTVRVRNTGATAGADVVQLYGRDIVASVTRPVAQLLAYARVMLEPGTSAQVTFDVPASRFSFTDRSLRRVVEPGTIELWVGTSSDHRECERVVELTGERYEVTAADARDVAVRVRRD